MRSIVAALVTVSCLLALPSALRAEDVLKPTKAQSALRKALKRVPSSERAAETKRRAIEYLAAWDASGKTPTATDGYALAQFLQSAERYKEAAAGFRVAQSNQGCKENVRDYAASAEAGLLILPASRKALGQALIDEAATRLTAYAAKMAGNPGRAKGRTTIRTVVAKVHTLAGRQKEAHAMRMGIVQDDPKSISNLVRPIVQGLLGSAHTPEGYKVMRTQAAAAMKKLRAIQGAKVAESKAQLDGMLKKLKAVDPAALGPDGRLKKTSTRGMSPAERAVYTAQRSFDTADKLMQSFDTYEKPFGMLGEPAETWTLEKAFGDVSALRDLIGKVVVLDFFATWPDLCNFPVLRDLHAAYAEKGLAVVGVTASAHVVYASRYDIDEDMASKGSPGARLFYAARLASESAPASPDQAIYDEEAYRTHEIEALAEFQKNHELKWPLVMIDKEEPAGKYLMEGWPHMLILDKQGYVRVIRGGVLARTDKAGVDRLRKVIEALLAE